ncbi:biotin synthase BioB [Qiania dongpingensis]|uniref:Biotin synthase n=1 Tax=Qiania dongpingensis TaxID=2763669 RepID=A0A7G9G0W7_9FIRM|nr:biotin synthase BioB [Qiania dongpingensis]QNM04449.1 biotin synthase BioB [Qiania dongpingensis]
MDIQTIKNRVLRKEWIGKAEAIWLAEQELEELCEAADEIRNFFCGNSFDICAIINGKSGRCTEDCKYCAQSAFYHTWADEYSLLSTEEIASQAEYNAQKGVLRYSIVTSGRCLSDKEVDRMCESIREIKRRTGLSVCVSFGLLNESQYRKLKEAGAERVHNNLESSRAYFPEVCTTHTYDDKIDAIRAAQAAGLSVCSGGIMGLGESMEDRIDMVLTIRKLGVHSIPLNILNPIPGTPYEQNQRLTEEEVRKITAIFRFLAPDASIRLAGGRGLLEDKGRSCFQSGANAAISGDMLTTVGITISQDLQMIRELGYVPRLWNR